MKKLITVIILLSLLMTVFMGSAFAMSEESEDVYSDIYIATVTTSDEMGNKISIPVSLRDCEYFDANGNAVDVSEAIDLILTSRLTDVHNPHVSLNSGYMMRYGDYYCTTPNQVTLSCLLLSSAKVAMGYSFTANPNSGEEKYTATTDKTMHSVSFYVPVNSSYKFYCTNISPVSIILEFFTINY